MTKAANIPHPDRPPDQASPPGSGRGGCIELSSNQISLILRAALDAGNIPFLLSRLDAVRSLTPAQRNENPRLSSSLLSGLAVLACLPVDGSFLGVNELAEMLDMTKSTTHRYLQTLLAAGLAVRDPSTRRYTLAR